VPTIEYQLASPDMLNRYFAFRRDGHDILFVTEGYPDSGRPFLFMAAHPVEPLVTAKCSSYARLDPPYHFIGSPSAVLFGWIQRLQFNHNASDLYRQPVLYEVTDFSDGTRYLWKEPQLGNPAFCAEHEVRLDISEIGGQGIGKADCRITRTKVLLQREGSLLLGYDRSVHSLNLLLHLAAFSFILARGVLSHEHVLSPATPEHIWGSNYEGPPSWV